MSSSFRSPGPPSLVLNALDYNPSFESTFLNLVCVLMEIRAGCVDVP